MLTYTKIRENTWIIHVDSRRLGYVCKRGGSFYPLADGRRKPDNERGYNCLRRAVRWLYTGSGEEKGVITHPRKYVMNFDLKDAGFELNNIRTNPVLEIF